VDEDLVVRACGRPQRRQMPRLDAGLENDLLVLLARRHDPGKFVDAR
jgi:hypothetical protein